MEKMNHYPMINMAVIRVKSMALAPIAIKAIFHCGSKQTVGMKVKREKVTTLSLLLIVCKEHLAILNNCVSILAFLTEQ